MSIESEISWIRCFLCREKSFQENEHKYIDSSACPESKKGIKDVIAHLARQSSIELHIPRGEWLCIDCYNQLLDYDASLISVLRKQRQLAQLVEKSLLYVDSEFEEECDFHMASLEELNNETAFNDVLVPEDEIEQTLKEETPGYKAKRSQPHHFKQQQLTPQQQAQQLNHHRQHQYQRELQHQQQHQHQQQQQEHEQDVSLGPSLHRKIVEILKCTFCAMRFKSKARLQTHISQAHKKYSCELCNFSHRNEDYVMLHMNLHEGRTENQCRFCDKEFTTKISTIRHMEVHFNNKKYQCDKCGLCFSQTTVLYNHKLQHEAEERPLRCETCNQVFKTKRTYRHHMITHRADRPRYSCEYCAKTFTEKYTLKVHKRIHLDIVEVNNSQQDQQQDSTDDSNAVHAPLSGSAPGTLGTIKFSCIICDQSFPNKDQLNKHMEKEHDVILKSLTLTNFSQYEVVTQDSKKPCHICGQMFTTQNNLDFHLESVHGVSFK